MLLYLAIPMTVGLSFLAKPVWEIFYGNHGLAAEVFTIFIFNGLTSSLYTVTLTIMQSVNKYKVVFASLFVEVMTKLVLQYPLMLLAYKLGIGAYCGNIAATILATMSTVIISIVYMKTKMKISLRPAFITTLKITAASLFMCLILYGLSKFIPVVVDGRTNAILVVIIYGIIGGGVYFAITYKNIFKKIFGKEILNKLFGRFKKSDS